MAIVRKSILPLGRHESPDGPIEVTPDRVAGYVKKFNTLRAAGVKFGVPWQQAHSEIASPDNHAFLDSKFNAGYVKEALVGKDGGLDVVLDCPGLKQDGENLVGVATLPDGNLVTTAIQEVSAGIWDTWTDGKGQTHSDIIGHVALVTMPVVAGQDGFKALGTAPKGTKVIHLSTITRLATDDENKEPKDAIDKDAPGDEANPAESLDKLFEPQESELKPNDKDAQLTRILARMETGGVKLPDGTTWENFPDRLETALEVLFGKSEKDKEAEVESALDEPAEPNLKEQPSPAGGLMLSTLRRIKSDPIYKALLDDKLKSARQARADKIAALKNCGVQPHVLAELESKPVMLSTLITPNGLAEDEAGRQIDLLLKVFGKDGKFRHLFLGTALPTAKETESPLVSGARTETVGTIKMTKAEKKIHDERLAHSHGKTKVGV